jgi:hypothetical protein
LAPDAVDPHLGSGDIDLCLSVAFTAGATRRYYESIQELIQPYFEPASANGARWRKKDGVPGLPLLIDFLAHGDEDEMPLADGTREETNPRAEENSGAGLRPFLIRAGALVDQDAIDLPLTGVRVVYRNNALADIPVRHTGPAGFLAAKADALVARSDSKDGYDVGWVCLNAASTPTEFGELVVARPVFRDPAFAERVAQLDSVFKSPEHIGPEGYASERHPQVGPGDREYDQARNECYAAVNRVVEVLKARLWSSDRPPGR